MKPIQLANPVVLIVLGAVALYLLGRWDGAISIAEAQHRAQVAQVLGTRDAYRARTDSLVAVEDGLRTASERLRATISEIRGLSRALTDSIARATAAARDGPLSRLLPPLGMVAVGPNVYATDSVGVRRLTADRLRLAEYRATVPLLIAESARWEQLAIVHRTGWQTARLRADTADVRVIELERLLARGERLRRCRVLMVPCPSRATSFALGAAVAIVAVLATP